MPSLLEHFQDEKRTFRGTRKELFFEGDIYFAVLASCTTFAGKNNQDKDDLFY